MIACQNEATIGYPLEEVEARRLIYFTWRSLLHQKDRRMHLELFSDAVMLIYRAASKYNPQRGAFTTYACSYLKYMLHLAQRNFNKYNKPFVSFSEPKHGHLWKESTPDLDTFAQDEKLFLAEAIKSLPDRDQIIINSYYGLNGEAKTPMIKISKWFNLSIARTHQIHVNALNAIHRAIRIKTTLLRFKGYVGMNETARTNVVIKIITENKKKRESSGEWRKVENEFTRQVSAYRIESALRFLPKPEAPTEISKSGNIMAFTERGVNAGACTILRGRLVMAEHSGEPGTWVNWRMLSRTKTEETA